MIQSQHTINTLRQTKSFARSFAQTLKAHDMVLLQGALGAGKTTICRYIIQFFNASCKIIPSPTYTLLQKYLTPSFAICHMDLYRLKSIDDLNLLGFEEELQSPTVFLIEWPKVLLGKRIPHKRIIHINICTKGSDRTAHINL